MGKKIKQLCLVIMLVVLFTCPVYGAHDFGSKSISESKEANAGQKKITVLEQVKLGQVRARTYNCVEISWEKVPVADGYCIYRKEKNKGWIKIYTVSSPQILSCVDTAAVPGITYTYTVRAFCREEGKTIWGAYDKQGLSVKVPAVPDSKMKSIVSEGYNRVKLTWKSISGVSGYRVYRKIEGQDWKALKTLGQVNSYLDKTVEPGVKYFYRVRAYYTVNGQKKWGGYSVAGTGVIPSLASVKLKNVTAAAYNKLVITWSPVDGATGYKIYMCQEKGTWKQIGTSRTTFFSHTVQTGKTYRYTVRAFRMVKGKTVYGGYDKKGISGKTVPDMPVLTDVRQLTNTEIRIQWEAAAGATHYAVFRKNAVGTWQLLAMVSGDITEYKHISSGKYPIELNKNYVYTVRSYNETEKTYGGYSVRGLSLKTGECVSVTEEQLSAVARMIIRKATDPSMTKEQKLRACWNYRKSFRYWGWKFPDTTKIGWHRQAAYDYLTQGGGNCYGIANGFAALAKELGYEPYVIEFYHWHCYVRIDGKYWDNVGDHMGVSTPWRGKQYTPDQVYKF